jgi:hypothetical protein
MLPYDLTPFQSSVRGKRKLGTELEHCENLADDRNDPRPEFARALCQVIEKWERLRFQQRGRVSTPGRLSRMAASPQR